MLIAIANNHNLSPTEQYSLFDPNTMRPQSNEKPIATAKRILALMEGALPLSPALDPLPRNSTGLSSFLSSPVPPLFAQVTDKALSRRVKKSMIRALSHSDADVQSCRIASLLAPHSIDNALLLLCPCIRIVSVAFCLGTISALGQLLSAVRGMWDYSQLHAEARYMRRYWSHVGVATENERKRRHSSSRSSLQAVLPEKGRVSCRLGCVRILRGRALVDIAGAKDMPTPIFDAEGSRGGGFLLCEAERSISSLAGVAFSTQCH